MKETIIKVIKDALEVSELSVSGSDAKYEIEITSNVFDGKSVIDRHKIVYNLLNEYIKTGEIHALTIKAKTASESEK